jgi:hypothetical protein
VRLRTFLGLKQSLTGRIEAALAKFASAVARLGAGTGKCAVRQRRVIRDSALEEADAVPCWILPEWRVSEQLPAELCAFDLVIIDEASQSDVTALPAIHLAYWPIASLSPFNSLPLLRERPWLPSGLRVRPVVEE